MVVEMKNKQYALYYADNYLFGGTRKELAEYLGVQEKTIYFYSSEAYKRRRKYNFSNCYLVIEVEDE